MKKKIFFFFFFFWGGGGGGGGDGGGEAAMLMRLSGIKKSGDKKCNQIFLGVQIYLRFIKS